MTISVINHTNGKLTDGHVQTAIRAVNRQIAEDFMPYWGFGAHLRLEGKAGKESDRQALSDMRGEAVLYLWDSIDVKDAAGYHEKNFKGISYAFVHVDLSNQLEEPWQVTFSHEALQLAGDPRPPRDQHEANAVFGSPTMNWQGWLRCGLYRNRNDAWKNFSSPLSGKLPNENCGINELDHGNNAFQAYSGAPLSALARNKNLYDFLALKFKSGDVA